MLHPNPPAEGNIRPLNTLSREITSGFQKVFLDFQEICLTFRTNDDPGRV